MQVIPILLVLLPLMAVVAILKSNKKQKNSILLLAVIALIVFSHQFTIVQEATARLTATAYVTTKYYDKNLKFQRLEWMGPFKLRKKVTY
ncbi:hypothetical protein GGQ84_002477 [Desulfitispora alkaliphila]